MRQVTEGLVLLLSCRKNFWLQPSRGYNQPRRGKRLRQFSFCLPNIFVVSNGTTKERKSFDSVLFICTIFFYSKVFIFVLPARVQPRRGKRLRQCSFFVSFLYLFHTLIFVHLARNKNCGCKGKEKAKQSIQFSLIHVVITKTKQKPWIVSCHNLSRLSWTEHLMSQICLRLKQIQNPCSVQKKRRGRRVLEKSSNSLVKTGGWREKHETNYSGKDGKTAKSLMMMIVMTMAITLMIKRCVKYVFVIKFDLGCSDRPLIYKSIKVHQHTLS